MTPHALGALNLSFEDAAVTSSVAAIAEPEEALAKSIIDKCKALRKVHQQFRSSIVADQHKTT